MIAARTTLQISIGIKKSQDIGHGSRPLIKKLFVDLFSIASAFDHRHYYIKILIWSLEQPPYLRNNGVQIFGFVDISRRSDLAGKFFVCRAGNCVGLTNARDENDRYRACVWITLQYY